MIHFKALIKALIPIKQLFLKPS